MYYVLLENSFIIPVLITTMYVVDIGLALKKVEYF